MGEAAGQDPQGDVGRREKSRAEHVIDAVLNSDQLRLSANFSTRSYGSEPILRTGADLKRDLDEHPRREGGRPDRFRRSSGTHSLDSHPHSDARRSTRAQRAKRAWQQSPAPERTPREEESLWQWLQDQLQQDVQDDEVSMPSYLEELRSLERQPDTNGFRLRGTELFLAQARLASEYTDDEPFTGSFSYHYQVTYQDLTNRELRGYFTWRTAWRSGEDTEVPGIYGRLLAAELVNGIGCEPGEQVVAQLKRLAEAYKKGDVNYYSYNPSLSQDLRRWARDYVVYYGLDPALVASDEKRAFGEGLRILRTAERETIARAGLKGLGPADLPEQPVTDQQIWDALCATSSYSGARSPLFRAHPHDAAAVGAGVFRDMVLHCAKRRKIGFLDGLFGQRATYAYTPFMGLPFPRDTVHEDVSVRFTAIESMSCKRGRWTVRCGCSSDQRNRDLGKLLRAIDRQMREDWGECAPLKPVDLPKYQLKFVAEQSRAQQARAEEAERRRIDIDFGQLAGIRSSAAVIREALLVDEEREESPASRSVMPTPDTAAAPDSEARQAAPAPSPASDSGATYSSDIASESEPAPGSNPCGLTDLELEALRRLLDDEGIKDLLGPGAPLESVLVDSINEKLFDELGDAALEYDGDRLHVVPDYIEDVRDIIEN